MARRRPKTAEGERRELEAVRKARREGRAFVVALAAVQWFAAWMYVFDNGSDMLKAMHLWVVLLTVLGNRMLIADMLVRKARRAASHPSMPLMLPTWSKVPERPQGHDNSAFLDAVGFVHSLAGIMPEPIPAPRPMKPTHSRFLQHIDDSLLTLEQTVERIGKP